MGTCLWRGTTGTQMAFLPPLFCIRPRYNVCASVPELGKEGRKKGTRGKGKIGIDGFFSVPEEQNPSGRKVSLFWQRRKEI